MIKVIAHIEVVPEFLEEVIAVQQEAVSVTLKEYGCIEYALFQQTDAPNRLTFVETWASDADLQVHMDTPFMIEKAKRLAGKIASKDVRMYKGL